MSKFDFFGSGGLDAEEFMKRQKKYASLKKDEIDSIPRDELVFAVTSWIEGKFADDWHDMCDKINSLPTPCLDLYCADYTAKEVLDGGFSQAFFNASRDFIGAGAAGFRALALETLADIIEEALKIHFDGGSKKGGGDLEAFIAFGASEEFASQDKAFREKFDRERFDRHAYNHIMRYKKYFGD